MLVGGAFSDFSVVVGNFLTPHINDRNWDLGAGGAMEKKGFFLGG